MHKFLLLVIVALFSSCEIPQFEIPTHEKSGSEDEPTETDNAPVLQVAEPKSLVESTKPRQDPEKSFNENARDIVSGKPKHPYLPENPF